MTRPISRRRFIRISAAAAGLAVVPVGPSVHASSSLVTWHGTMLGAVATMQIHHQDRNEAQRLVQAACGEARRLERLFSLYLEDSALVQLNRSGILVDPSAELVDLLTTSLRFAEVTGGRFDPTVQPLWTLYADHFLQSNADPAGPPRPAVEAALAHVGYDRLTISRDRIVMPRGTAVTLNGIAQGYKSSICFGRGVSFTVSSIWGRRVQSVRVRTASHGKSESQIPTCRAGPKRSFRSLTARCRRPAPTASASTRRAASTISSIPRPARVLIAIAA